jgi:hypothetical protein
MVNKRDVKVFIVCLSVCLVILVWESFHIIGQEVPRLRFSMILLYLQWKVFALFLEFSNIWCRHSFSRGMRRSTYILWRALLMFSFTLTINHFKMLMIRAMGAETSEYHISNISLRWSIWKLDITLLMFFLRLSSVYLKCPPLHSISRRILYDHYRMSLLCFISICIHLVHSAFFYVLLCESLLESLHWNVDILG